MTDPVAAARTLPRRSGDRPSDARPYAGRRGWFGMLPFPLKLLLVLIVAAVVVTHLPLILVGLVVWVLLARGHRGWHGPQRS